MHDRYSKKYDNSMENRYNPAQFDPAMYENKAAVIAQRWDSQEQLDRTFTASDDPADPVHTGRLAISPKKPTSLLAKVTHTRFVHVWECLKGGRRGFVCDIANTR